MQVTSPSQIQDLGNDPIVSNRVIPYGNLGKIKLNDVNNLEVSFSSAEIPWIEPCYKHRKPLKYQAVTQRHRYLTRILSNSAVLINVLDLLDLILLARTRDVSSLRARLAMLEMRERRAVIGRECAFNMTEFRRLIGSTRITKGLALNLWSNRSRTHSIDELEWEAQRLNQSRFDRKVWVPRRLIRMLARSGSRIEIGVALLVCLRRRYDRLNRARLGARHAAKVLRCSPVYVRRALLTLREKRVLLRHHGARWATNRYGAQYEIATDLTLPTPSGKLRREKSKKKFKDEKNAKRIPLLKIDPRYRYLEQQQLLCKSTADAVWGFIEHQSYCGMLLLPDDPDLQAGQEKPPKSPTCAFKAPRPPPKPPIDERSYQSPELHLKRVEQAAAARRKYLQAQIDQINSTTKASMPSAAATTWVPKTTAECDERRALLLRQAEQVEKLFAMERKC